MQSQDSTQVRGEKASQPDHTACQAAHNALYEAAVEAMENPGLMSPKDYLDYRLGTAGHLYHREGWEATLRERDEARQYAATLAAQVQQAIEWCVQDDAEPMVAVHALKRFLRDFPPPEGVR